MIFASRLCNLITTTIDSLLTKILESCGLETLVLRDGFANVHRGVDIVARQPELTVVDLIVLEVVQSYGRRVFNEVSIWDLNNLGMHSKAFRTLTFPKLKAGSRSS